MVAITGQVGSPLLGTDAFQEADIRGITMPITKHNLMVTKAEDIPRAIAAAFHIASTGRPGPVLVDIPKDVQNAEVDFTWPPAVDLPGYKPNTKPHNRQIAQAAKMIAQAERPVLYIGGGVVPRLGEWFARSPFRARFENKGRFSNFTARIPCFVIHAACPALSGAAVLLEQHLAHEEAHHAHA